MRDDTNFVDLSSRERTRAPSALLLTTSYKPGKPVTATILLYSIFLNFGYARYEWLFNDFKARKISENKGQ
jgi:hypothetical protein